MTTRLCCALLTLALAAGAGQARAQRFVVADGDTVWLTDTVTVLGSRLPASLPGLLRPLGVADPDEDLPARSIPELLAALPAVEVNQRQLFGTQSDLGIRGSSFEQVQVLLDGWDVGDAQTGHHNLDLPLDLSDLARLEVLRGHGSALYGANAFGGVLNVVPRTPSPRRGGELALGGGDHGTRSGRLRLESGEGVALGLHARAWLSGAWFETDGDRPGTDARNGTAALRAVGDAGWGDLELLTGYASREFGALDFYAPFPSWEETETAFAGIKLRTDLSDAVVLEQRLGGRRHRDRFVLLRDDPDVYVNVHVTRRAVAETRLRIEAGYGLAVAVGAEGLYEDIRSDGIRGGAPVSALGEHERRRVSGSFEISGRHATLLWSLGTRLDGWSVARPRLSRSAATSLDLGEGVRLRASAGTVFRLPTFTELHYEDPANRGDPDLSPEHGWSWDAGGEVRRGAWSASWEYFTRFEHDLIDWARPAADLDAPWRVMNIAVGEVRGWTQTVRLDTPRGDALFLSHTYLDRERSLPDDHLAKYGFLAPRHLLSSGAAVAAGRRLRLTSLLRFRERSDGSGHWTGDLRAVWSQGPWRFDLDVTNVFDRHYEEIPGVPLPGRMTRVVTEYSF